MVYAYGCVTSMQVVLQRNTSDVFRIAGYQHEVFTGFYQAPRNVSILYSFRITVEREVNEMILNNKTLFRLCSVVHVLVREELRDILVFSIRENAEHGTQRARSLAT